MPSEPNTNRRYQIALGGLVALAAVVHVAGITWGLPSRQIDTSLFDEQTPWSGERIAAISQADAWRQRNRAADVDTNPLARRGVSVTASDADVAEILRRYRLFSHQPDEMITFMALARMKPGRGDFDPRLYQYGGLFIYPVGAFLKLGSLVGLVELRAEPSYYFDHPEAFGRFYVVARLYVVLFALAGVVGVYGLTTHLSGKPSASLLAAGLYACMPITINLAHEAKPHLPAAVLMVFALWAGLRFLDHGKRRDLILLGVLAGSALGMVLSAWVIFLVLPTVALLRSGSWKRRAINGIIGGAIGLCVYAITNPYSVFNALTRHEVWRENLANSRTFYPLTNPIAGLHRTAWLVAEGMSPLLAVAAVAAVVLVVATPRWRQALLLLVPAAAILINMAMVGAGKPGEFGRFALFADIMLAIVVATAAIQLAAVARGPAIAAVVLCVCGVLVDAWRYERSFLCDASPNHTRAAAATWLADNLPRDSSGAVIGVLNDPAPYLTPPLAFSRHEVIVLPNERPMLLPDRLPMWLIDAGDYPWPSPNAWWRQLYEPIQAFPETPTRAFWNRPTVISWANKPITIYQLSLAGITRSAGPLRLP